MPLEALSASVLSIEPTRHGPVALRYSAFGAHPIGWGVQWGGAAGLKLSKDLQLRPRLRAQGRRFDLTCPGTLHLALDLFESIAHAQPNEITDLLQLPEVWAGFLMDFSVEGDGPELDGLCSRLGLSRQQLMMRRRREHEGLQLYPLDFTSHAVEHARLFVEPGTVPDIQVIQCVNPAETLTGFRGACEFSLLNSAFNASASLRIAQHT